MDGWMVPGLFARHILTWTPGHSCVSRQTFNSHLSRLDLRWSSTLTKGGAGSVAGGPLHRPVSPLHGAWTFFFTSMFFHRVFGLFITVPPEMIIVISVSLWSHAQESYSSIYTPLHRAVCVRKGHFYISTLSQVLFTVALLFALVGSTTWVEHGNSSQVCYEFAGVFVSVGLVVLAVGDIKQFHGA